MRTPIALLALLVSPVALAGARLDDPVTPTAERVSLLIDPDEPTYTGDVEIDVTIGEKIDRFRVHAEDLDIREGSIVRGKRAWPVTVAPGEAGTVSVVASKPLKPGDYTLRLEFENEVNTQSLGLYGFEHGGQHFVVTQFEADDARAAFPCFDEPSFKIPWEITVEVPERSVAVSNMPAASETVEGGWKVVSFEPTPPTSSYLVALAVGPYVAVPVEGVGHVYTVPGTEAYAGFLVEQLPRSIAWMEEWFGRPYPYPKLDWVVVPQFSFGAMENPGLVVGRSDASMLDPATASAGRTLWVGTVINHEVAHMWFGDLVTMAWWDDLWLNESFADWLARVALADLFPGYGSEAERVAMSWEMLRAEGYEATRPLRTDVDPSSVFETTNTIWYDKGQGVLTAVEAWLGEEAFQAGVRAWIDDGAWGNATAADLFAALSEASGEDVAAMLLPYLDRPGAPLVRIARNGSQAKVSQQRFAVYGAEVPDAGPWIVPMRWKVGRPDGTVETVDVVLTDTEAVIDIGETDWVMPTADGVGYFVWSQPLPALTALVAAAPEHLTPLERVALVLDVVRLMDAGELLAGDAYTLLEGLRGETDPEVVSRLLSLATLMDEIAPADQEEAVASWVRDTFRPALDEIGTEPAQGETPAAARLRPDLLWVLGKVGQDPDVLAFAQEVTARFQQDPSTVDSAVAQPALMLAAAGADLAFQERMLDAWRGTEDPQLANLYLNAAARVPGPEARERVLALAMAPDTSLDTRFTIITSVFEDEEDKDAGLEWAMANHLAIWDQMPPYFRPMLIWYGGGCSEERFAKAAAFYGAPDRAVPGTQERIAEFGARVASCVTRKALHGESVATYLAERESASAEP